MILFTNIRRLATILGLTAAIAAGAAPTALANHQDVGVKEALREIRGTAAIPDAVERYVRNHRQSATAVECDAVCRYLHNHPQGVRLITDTLGGNGGAPRYLHNNSQGVRLITDTLGGNGGAPLPLDSRSPGFSWSAAAAGAASGVGSLLLVATATMLVLRRRSGLAV
jgi:hypothetical protein